MKIEKLDRVALGVQSVDEAVRLFSNLFETAFEISPRDTVVKSITEHADRTFEERKVVKVAISPIGLELIETSPPVEKGVRSFHLKVTNLEEAKKEMKEKGIRLLADITHGGLKEAIYSPDDLHGARLVLVEYEAPTPMGAIHQK